MWLIGWKYHKFALIEMVRFSRDEDLDFTIYNINKCIERSSMLNQPLTSIKRERALQSLFPCELFLDLQPNLPDNSLDLPAIGLPA